MHRVGRLDQLPEQDRSPRGRPAEIENVQVAMFNAKVLIPLIELSENANEDFGGYDRKARDEMKNSLIKTIHSTLTIEEQVIAGDNQSALQTLEWMLRHQHATHLIFQ